MIGFVLFFAWLGFGGDYIAYLWTTGDPTGEPFQPDRYRHVFPWFGIVVTAIGAGFAASAYRKGPRGVLWASGAREVTVPQTDAERQLVNVVEEMAIASGLPRPRIWIVPDDDPNAFATGHKPEDAHVAVTNGLLAVCTRDELQGVIGHELGHIKNLDVRLMTTLAALVGAVALLGDGIGRSLGRGRIGGRG
ncbi:MAG: M48 family metalloprotease, partial [Gemmatimonadales bacterium]